MWKVKAAQLVHRSLHTKMRNSKIWKCSIRYQQGHAIKHWKESQHCYSLEVETQRVWDYVGDGYVHRLIQSKTDGKLVELNAPCSEGTHECGSYGCSHDVSGMSEALMNSKLDGVS
jgi:BRCA1-associated protein